MDISYSKHSKLIKDVAKDFESNNLAEEEIELIAAKRKRKYTIIGLTTLYVFLIALSLTLIS